MAIDVMSEPTYSVTLLRWYKPSETTPFALCGHIGPVLAQVNQEKYGGWPRELWFGDDGWQQIDGQGVDEDDVIAFAIPRAPTAEQDAALAEVALNAALAMADSEGTRAVQYLRRARKAEAALELIARAARGALPPTRDDVTR